MLFSEGLNWRVVFGIFGTLGQGRDTEPTEDTRQRHSGRPCSAYCREGWQEGEDGSLTIIWFDEAAVTKIASYQKNTIQKETRIREPQNPHISKWSILQGHVSWCLVISPSLDRQLPALKPLKGLRVLDGLLWNPMHGSNLSPATHMNGYQQDFYNLILTTLA